MSNGNDELNWEEMYGAASPETFDLILKKVAREVMQIAQENRQLRNAIRNLLKILEKTGQIPNEIKNDPQYIKFLGETS